MGVVVVFVVVVVVVVAVVVVVVVVVAVVVVVVVVRVLVVLVVEFGRERSSSMETVSCLCALLFRGFKGSIARQPTRAPRKPPTFIERECQGSRPMVLHKCMPGASLRADYC